MNKINRTNKARKPIGLQAITFFLRNLLEKDKFPIEGAACLNDIIGYLDSIKTYAGKDKDGEVYKTWIFGEKFKVRYRFETEQFEFFASDDPLKHWTV